MMAHTGGLKIQLLRKLTFLHNVEQYDKFLIFRFSYTCAGGYRFSAGVYTATSTCQSTGLWSAPGPCVSK